MDIANSQLELVQSFIWGDSFNELSLVTQIYHYLQRHILMMHILVLELQSLPEQEEKNSIVPEEQEERKRAMCKQSLLDEMDATDARLTRVQEIIRSDSFKELSQPAQMYYFFQRHILMSRLLVLELQRRLIE